LKRVKWGQMRSNEVREYEQYRKIWWMMVGLYYCMELVREEREEDRYLA
jgi:hypothetical protein